MPVSRQHLTKVLRRAAAEGIAVRLGYPGKGMEDYQIIQQGRGRYGMQVMA